MGRQQAESILEMVGSLCTVKNDRLNQLKQENQENVLNILGALFLIEMTFLKKVTKDTDEIDVFDETSSLFILKNWTKKAIPSTEIICVLDKMMENDGEINMEFGV